MAETAGTKSERIEPPPPTPPGLNHLPSDLPIFIGREQETGRIVKRFSEATARLGGPACAIVGMGGVGKTALAIHAAHHVVDSYPDAQIVIDLQGTSGQPLSPAEAMGRVIHMLRPDVHLPANELELMVAYHATLTGQRALLLLEDARDSGQVRPLLPPEGCAAIVTSRRALELPGVEPIHLGVLAGPAAVDLIRRIAGQGRAADRELATDQELSAIADLCGHLPLALRAAAGLLASRDDLRADQLIRALRDERSRLDELRDGDVDVGAALGLSAALLARDAPGLAARWQMLSVFRGRFHFAGAARVWEVELTEAQDHLADLAGRSLVLYDEEPGTVRIHDLMREVARSVFSYGGAEFDQSEQAQRLETAAYRHASFYAALGRVCARMYSNGGEGILSGLWLFDQMLPNLRVAWERMEARARAGAREDDEAVRWVCAVPGMLGELLSLRVKPVERVSMLEVAVEAGDQGLGERRAEGALLASLGTSYAGLGDTRQAIACTESALHIMRELGDRQGVGGTLGNLGLWYARLGNLHRAIEHHVQTIEIAQEIGDRQMEGAALSDLGAAYAGLSDHHRSIEHYAQSLEIARELGDRLMEGYALGNIGAAHTRLGDHQRAIDYHTRALEITRELGDRRGQAVDLNNLAVAHLEMGDAQKAKDFVQSALAIACELDDRRSEGRYLVTLGQVFAGLGDGERASQCLAEALAIARQVGDPVSALRLLRKLADALAKGNDFPQAIRYREEALQIAQEINDPRAEAGILAELADACIRMGDRERARDYLEEQAAIAHAMHDRRVEGDSEIGLGLTYAGDGDEIAAIVHFERALAAHRESGNKQREQTDLVNIGTAHVRDGQPERAIAHYQQALKIARDLADRVQEPLILAMLGETHATLGDSQRAVECFGTAITIHREMQNLGPAIACLFSLADVHAARGERRRAIERLSEALELARERGDPVRERHALGILGNTYREIGELSQAEQCLEDLLKMAHEAGAREEEGLVLGMLSVVYTDRDELDRAADCLEQGLEIAREMGDEHYAKEHQRNLTFVARKGARNAGYLCEEALKEARRWRDRRAQGRPPGGRLRAAWAISVRRSVEGGP